jgi:hypothetical protein
MLGAVSGPALDQRGVQAAAGSSCIQDAAWYLSERLPPGVFLRHEKGGASGPPAACAHDPISIELAGREVDLLLSQETGMSSGDGSRSDGRQQRRH